MTKINKFLVQVLELDIILYFITAKYSIINELTSAIFTYKRYNIVVDLKTLVRKVTVLLRLIRLV